MGLLRKVMDEQETKHFLKSVDLPAVSLAGATPFSYLMRY
jgi:hypothetical protein